MGTRWRGMLAPIDKPTGDGRRFAHGALRHRPLPLALKWQREDDAGHDASVVIGMMDRLTIDEDSGEVWAEGELFDDQGASLPRLTEDVREAILLTTKRVIGPSVDAGAATAILVEVGQDEPVSEERMEELFWESVATGVDPALELLFTDYEIAAATLVSIPAFVEARPFELLDPAVAPAAPASPALVAALTAAAAPATIPADVFRLPSHVTEITPVTVEPAGEDGYARVYGYVAAHGTCHLQFRGMCVTPPSSESDYALFHRYPVQTDGGDLLGVGRLTTGHGRVGTGCGCCPGKDDHACDGADFASTVAHYDQLTTLAWVRAGEDERGIWVAGIAAPDLTPADRQVLAGQKFSGDWRDVGGHLEMVEVLALAVGRPGFPLPATAIRDGRQVSLTAAGGIPPRPGHTVPAPAAVSLSGAVEKAFFAAAEAATAPLRAMIDDLAAKLHQTRGLADAHAAVTAAEAHTGAMIALRMTDDDANRLAVDGGEPADELHVTLAYLGDGADIDNTARARIVDAVSAAVAEVGVVDGDGFSVSAFNPAGPDRETAIVLGVGGDALTDVHTRVMDALAGMMPGDAECDPDEDGDCPPKMDAAGFALPEQHSPWVPHIALAYSDDLGLVEQLVDRCGPVRFDRVRFAFAGAVTDITLTPTPGQQATTAAAQLDAALSAGHATRRRGRAAALIAELEKV